jgi:hypothetical protein
VDTANQVMEDILQDQFWENRWKPMRNALSNSKPPPNSEKTLPFVIVGDEAFPLNKYLLRPYPGVSALNEDRKQIYIYRL